MINAKYLMISLLAMPILFAISSMLIPGAEIIIIFCAIGTIIIACLSYFAAWCVFSAHASFTTNNWLMLDALSAYHLTVMVTIFLLSSLYSISYFKKEIKETDFTNKLAKRYGALWFGALGAMILVFISNNIVIMWVGIEATTLLTAFLICIHITPSSLEAMWKYLLMCSVGVAVAFIGTLLVAASTYTTGLQRTDSLLWTNLMKTATTLNPSLLKAGFIFLVIGYGTKAGLAPMHNWLPDAHSQAPAPVSAVFSGFLLNTALFCILKYLPIIEITTGNVGWGRSIFVVLGILSILVAAVFIVAQHDIKRLLAYHSVEHLGIIALGVGVGGLGQFAALFHTLNHSLCKMLSFFCAGKLGQVYRTHDMRQITSVIRSSPVWGIGLIGSLLALIGIAPFALFLSEFMILKAAYDNGLIIAAILFLVGLGIVFVGALKHVISMAWEPSANLPATEKISVFEGALVFVILGILLILGLWMPEPLSNVLTQAAHVLGGYAS